MEFDATLDLDGKTATGIVVPGEVIDALGAGRRPVVRVTVNGHTFSTTVGSMQGVAKIPVSADNRKLVGAVAGDALRVSVVVDTAPVEVEVPGEFAGALASDQPAAEFFAGLTASQKKGFVVPVAQAKTAETRDRRIEKAMAALRAGQKRP
jgi:hypothetical protein